MKLGYSIVILLIVAVGIFFLVRGGKTDTATQNDSQNMQEETTNTETTTEPTAQNELLMTVTKEGTGAEAKDGDTVSVHYVGTFQDGTKFDSSRDRGQAFEFTLGAGQVIKGWDIGVKGMKVGEVRKLVIPPQYGYGEAGAGSVIPPNSTLFFEVELLAINP